MTTDGAQPEKSRPGRPRSAPAERAILDATLDLLCEVGFEGLSIEGVAALAGVGKTTIYRRWASKQDLILAAIQRVRAEAPIVDTGNFRDDLRAMARMAEQGGPASAFNRLLPRLLGDSVIRPALFRTFLQATFAPRVEQIRAMMERAQARGEIRADIDPIIVLNMYAGALMSGWLLFSHMSILPPDFVEQSIEALWNGIRCGDPG